MTGRRSSWRASLAGALAILIVLIGLVPTPIGASPSFVPAPDDWDIPGGHFFTQTGGGGGLGYAVTDEGSVPFWSEFNRLGGVQGVGYPASRRFRWNGFTCQVFQRVVFQWNPQTGQVNFVNVFDLFTEMGKDQTLLETRQVPLPKAWNEAGLSWEQIVAARTAVMDTHPAIKAAYYGAVGDPVQANGLPTSDVVDMGNHYALRSQRVSFQEWKEDVPWAKAGQVTVSLGGDLSKEMGILPDPAALVPEPASGAAPGPEPIPGPDPPGEPNGTVVVLDPGHGGGEVGAAGGGMAEKELTLELARRARERLVADGFTVVLTRDADEGVNVAGADRNGNGVVDNDDDLQARVDVANESAAAVFVSIHINGSNSPGLRGLTTYYCADSGRATDSRALAGAIHAASWSHLEPFGSDDLGVQDDGNLGKPFGHLFLLGAKTPRVARAPAMPAVLVEVLFLSNAADRALLARDDVRAAAASGIADGIADYLSATP